MNKKYFFCGFFSCLIIISCLIYSTTHSEMLCKLLGWTSVSSGPCYHDTCFQQYVGHYSCKFNLENKLINL